MMTSKAPGRHTQQRGGARVKFSIREREKRADIRVKERLAERQAKRAASKNAGRISKTAVIPVNMKDNEEEGSVGTTAGCKTGTDKTLKQADP